MKVSIIGAGAFGTALATQIARNGHEVLLWSYEKQVVEEINHLHRNNQFLPEIELPYYITSSHDLDEVIQSGEVIFNATPVFAIRNTYRGKDLAGKSLISASKGIEKGTHNLLHEVFSEVIASDYKYAALSGPSFATELAQGLDTAATVASSHQEALETAKKLLSADNFKVQTSKDVVGVELAGALKNVLAIASGLASGASLGKNFQASIFTEGLSEMISIGQEMGAKRETFYSLAALGDLFLTSTSDQSRNFTFGFSLGKGDSVEEALKGKTVEGVGSAESAAFLARKFKVKAPLFENIFEIVSSRKSAQEALKDIWHSINF